jgi:hypothetical protein
MAGSLPATRQALARAASHLEAVPACEGEPRAIYLAALSRLRPERARRGRRQTLQKLVRALGLPLSALDQTHSFILLVRAQMVGDEPPPAVGDAAFSAAGSVSPAEQSRRLEIARIASDGGRFFTSFIHQLLEGNRSSE